VGLGEARYRKLSGFSTGMKQRVKLAQALVHGPKLVFLDEPTNGLDPQGRDEMLDLIGDVKARGVSIVLSSHILYDVEQVCDSVIMLDQGKLIHHGPIDALKAGDGERVVEVQTKNEDEKLRHALVSRGFDAELEGFRLRVHLDADADAQDILDVALEEDIQVRHFMPGELTLEKAFLGLLDEHAHDNDAQTA
jgi:ABC-2 type transport system ATP-binding protein